MIFSCDAEDSLPIWTVSFHVSLGGRSLYGPERAVRIDSPSLSLAED